MPCPIYSFKVYTLVYNQSDHTGVGEDWREAGRRDRSEAPGRGLAPQSHFTHEVMLTGGIHAVKSDGTKVEFWGLGGSRTGLENRECGLLSPKLVAWPPPPGKRIREED